jgi:hypothetical protein
MWKGRSSLCKNCACMFSDPARNPNNNPKNIELLRSRKGSLNPNWNGGSHKDTSGYIKILCPDHPRSNGGYVVEHILIMEKSLGRYVTINEAVHHINGDKADNRIENLKLFSSSGDHTKYHHSICKRRVGKQSAKYIAGLTERMRENNPMCNPILKERSNTNRMAVWNNKTDIEKYEAMRKMVKTRYGVEYTYEQWKRRKSKNRLTS